MDTDHLFYYLSFLHHVSFHAFVLFVGLICKNSQLVKYWPLGIAADLTYHTIPKCQYLMSLDWASKIYLLHFYFRYIWFFFPNSCMSHFSFRNTTIGSILSYVLFLQMSRTQWKLRKEQKCTVCLLCGFAQINTHWVNTIKWNHTVIHVKQNSQSVGIITLMVTLWIPICYCFTYKLCIQSFHEN